jgi:peptide/nickel transport system permease protein
VLAYLLRRLVPAVAVVLLLSFLGFVVFASRIDPIAPLRMQSPYPKERIARITKRANLDKPVAVRYWLWVKGIVTGSDAGHTIVEDQPIWPPVWVSLRHSVQLVAATLVVVVVSSIAIGTMGARRPGSGLDVASRGFSYLAWSIPVFLLAVILQQLVYRLEGWTGHELLPGTGWPTGSGLGYAKDWFRHLALPVLTLAATYVGAHSRYVRSSLAGALAAPYSVVARAKGLPERTVTRRALRTALIPFVTVVALDFGGLLGASFAVDWIFRLQGMGSLWVAAVAGYDPYQLEAVLVVTAVVVVAFSLLADLALGWLDPRVRLT